MTTQKPVAVKPKRNPILGAISDLIVLLLLLSAAGFGGYFWGTHQRMAPVELVPSGTPGAHPVSAIDKSAKPAETTSSTDTGGTTETAKESSEPAPPSTPAATTRKPGKMKYWLSSKGADMVGYSISVSVNDQPVDNFFSPGKQVDVTRLVKKGKNTVAFEAQENEKFNQHKGDPNAVLVVNVVQGPVLQDEYKASDVRLTYKRNASESGNFSDNYQFTAQ